MSNPNFDASTKYQQAANVFCKPCHKDFYFDIKKGINVVLVRHKFGTYRVLNQKKMKFKVDSNEMICLSLY